MVRNGYTRRLFTVLLVLLTITPQNLLRPCCCSRIQALVIDAQPAVGLDADVLDSEGSALAEMSPCCRERLMAAQRAVTHQAASSHCESTATATPSEGLSKVIESPSCSCRSTSETPRVERVVFRQADLKALAILTLFYAKTSDPLSMLTTQLSCDISTTELRLRPDCVQLCRWIV